MHIKTDKTATLQRLAAAAATNDMKQVFVITKLYKNK